MTARPIWILFLAALLAGCGQSDAPAGAAEAAHAAPTGEYERGPHRGRLLRDGDFALEITIFETNVPPEYRLYAYRAGKPLPPAEVTATIRLERLDGEVNDFAFAAQQDFLRGNGTVGEPHSFDVTVTARHAGKAHTWKFASYEGRTTMPAKAAAEAGVKVEVAGPALIRTVTRVMGSVAMDPNRQADVKARFPGIVREVRVQQGQRVRRGQTLAIVEANESMRTYAVTAPIDGVVLLRSTNVGDVAGDAALVRIADLARVWVELHAIGKDAARLAPGQRVTVRSATGEQSEDAVIEALLPLATVGQSVVARASLDNAAGAWRPGMAVAADVVVAEHEAALAVRESGLQRFRDFTVVFAQVGETYEVRMLELGARDGEYAEVLGGLKPGTRYVAEQSFLIKADIEKSGASHDH